MFKFIRKNQKKVLAIFSVGLMVAFALPTATSQFRGGREGDYGTITVGGEKVKISGKEYTQLINEWKFLHQKLRNGPIQFLLGGGRQNMELGQGVAMHIDQHPDVYVLLLKEAQAMNVSVSDDLVRSVLRQIDIDEEQNPQGYHEMYGPLKNLLMVVAAVERANDVYKVSQPVLDHTRATRLQEIAVDLIEFNARDFLNDVAEPTAQQIQAHFDKYKDTDREASATGFGYHFPNRVKFDAVTIRTEELRKAIKPVEVEEQMEYYLRNKNSSELSTTTQPSTSPTDLSLSAGPTTRPMTFKEAQDKIKKTLTDQRMTELGGKVRDAVRNTIRADYDLWRAANEAKKPATQSSLGAAAYNSFAYLQALRDKIQKDFGVLLTIEDNGHWTDRRMLADSELGKLTLGEERIPAAGFLTTRIDKFLTEEQAGSLRSDRKASLWEPTPVFSNNEGRYAIARVTAADPAHTPAKLDDVKDQVVSDVKLSLAYEKAKQAAKAAVEAAEKGRWLQTVAEDAKRKLISTGLFARDVNPQLQQLGIVPPIPGYDVASNVRQAFVDGAFALLSEKARTGSSMRPATSQPTTRPASTQPVALKDHPIGLIELPKVAKVLVGEVNLVKPSYTRDTQSMHDLRVMMSDRNAMEGFIRVNWFGEPNVKARTGFKPARAESEAPARKERKPLPLDNPFVGMGG